MRRKPAWRSWPITNASRDWEHAAGIARKLEASGQGSFTGRLAHYLCEQAATLLAQGDESSARALLEQAIASAPQVPRPRMDLAALWTRSGQAAKACKTLTEALYAAPSAIPLIAPLLAQSALAAGEGEATLALLKSTYLDVPSLDVLDAIVTLEASSSELTPTARRLVCPPAPRKRAFTGRSHQMDCR